MQLTTLPNHIVYMKAGFFIEEPLERILKRKREEAEVCKRFFWGYSGSICHPRTQIQPFANAVAQTGQSLFLAMSITESELRKPAMPATQFSEDRKKWDPLPTGVEVYGSKFALVCGPPVECNLRLDLRDFVVGIGDKKGTRLDSYVRHRVDKGCAFRTQEGQCEPPNNGTVVDIFWIAEIVHPYAVYLR